MDKYKIIAAFLAFALCVNIARLVYVSRQQPTSEPVPSKTMLSLIQSRKSVRSFTQEPVSPAQIDTLLRAAMAAPTGHNLRPWKFIVVDDNAILDTLGRHLANAPMLTEVPVAIVVCGDMSVKNKLGKPSGNWVMDCSAATQNLLLAAESMQLGAVWTGAYPYEDRMALVRRVLHLPDHLVPLNVIPVGHAAGQPQPKDKYDKNNIHYNSFD